MQVSLFWLLNLFAFTVSTRLMHSGMFCSIYLYYPKQKTPDFTAFYTKSTPTEKVSFRINSRSQVRIIEKCSEVLYSSYYCIRPNTRLYQFIWKKKARTVDILCPHRCVSTSNKSTD